MVQIIKTTTVTPMTTDNKEMKTGCEYAYQTREYCGIGEFDGLTKKGALSFITPLDGSTVHVMPATIDKIYEVDMRILAEEDEEVE